MIQMFHLSSPYAYPTRLLFLKEMLFSGYAYTGNVLVFENHQLSFTHVIVGFGSIGTKLERKAIGKKFKYSFERFLKIQINCFQMTNLYQLPVSCLDIDLYNVLAISIVIWRFHLSSPYAYPTHLSFSKEMYFFGYAYIGTILVFETRHLFFTYVIVGFVSIGTKLEQKVVEKKFKYLFEKFLKNTIKLFSNDKFVPIVYFLP